MSRLFPATIVLSLISVLGCGQATDPNRPKTYPVSGTVTQAGQPVEGANVVFQLADGSRGAVGVTDASGKYTLTTFSAGDGAVVGDYKVAITKYDRPAITPKSDGSIADTGDEPEEEETGRRPADDSEPKSLLPEKYANPEGSGLTATVSESGENKFDFTLD
jgi:hypothetical protein